VSRSGGAVAVFDVLALTERAAPAGAADRGPARCGICRGTPAGPGGSGRRVPDFFAFVAGRPKAGRARPGDRGDPWETTAFAVSAALLGVGVILAVVLLPSRCPRLEEFRNAAAAAPALVPAPAPQPDKHAIPVAPVGCSPVITHVRGMQLAGAGSFQAQHVVPGPSSPQHLGATPLSCTPLTHVSGTGSHVGPVAVAAGTLPAT
jgi:hypothetical protein